MLFPGFTNYSDRMSPRSRQGRRLQSLNSNLIQYTKQDKSGKRARGAREEVPKTAKNRWSYDLTGFRTTDKIINKEGNLGGFGGIPTTYCKPSSPGQV